jgi:hypothetical protein
MVQSVTTQATPSNASQSGMVTPRPVEQMKTSGIKPVSPSGVTAAEENDGVKAETEQQNTERAAVQRQQLAANSSRGSNLDVLV